MLHLHEDVEAPRCQALGAQMSGSTSTAVGPTERVCAHHLRKHCRNSWLGAEQPRDLTGAQLSSAFVASLALTKAAKCLRRVVASVLPSTCMHLRAHSVWSSNTPAPTSCSCMQSTSLQPMVILVMQVHRLMY